MKWHLWSKNIYRRLVIFFTGIFGALLFTKSNLIGAKGIHKYPEINHLLEGEFLEEIRPFQNWFFGGLMIIGIALLVVGWKPYSNRRREGIWLNNIATGFLATVFLTYGITTLTVLKLMSYDAILAFVISGLLYVLFIKNVIHYSKNKKIFVQERSMKRVIVSVAIALILVALGTISFCKKYKNVYAEEYNEYKKEYSSRMYSLDAEDYDKENYIRLKFINYFNIDGENITIEELKQSVENYNNDSGSWYELWYCIDFLYELRYTGIEDINFTSYGWDEKPDVAYLSYVKIQLLINGAPGLGSASYEEIDQACQQVYEIYANQYPIELLGDDEGELVLNLDMADSKNIEDWSISCEDDYYYGRIGSCRQASSIEDSGNGNDAVTELKNGELYKLTLYIDIPLPYKTIEEPQVEINGIEYKKLSVSGKDDNIRIDLWIIPDNEQ